ncbi:MULTISPECIES: N-acetylmuramic acid 6-phosphate etherase [unclassified Brevibacterium]|uniref:N-acetylmuramic acid 6-phosphate etherase n=1 Tax=unclassified Brevibacterium TaxID=2614124 RepID=UPI001092701C|nr:N-acetylmuramic acid 6-phosphate etherase [Brevibacterium sp. S22]TGD27632.1 N-acetylmuramic acid 6-phosphate etherase [Brevibacterium sp. S22]
MTDSSPAGSPSPSPASSSPKTPRPLSPTEQRNPRSAGLDELDTLGVLRVLNTEDHAVIDAVAAALPQLARLVDIAAERMRRGGRVHYFGAGTSGRLGVLDASELLPTFNLEPGRVVGHIAGGQAALVNAVENAEDSEADGCAAGAELGPDDVAIGIAASGSTPYVGGALEAARAAGAHAVLISNNPHAPVAEHADDHILLDTGPEVITGSTRLKAGTAQKLALNGFSTALMVALGRTWDNLMVSVVATNDKLRERTVRILMEAADLPDEDARELLERCDGDLKTAIVVSFAEAAPALAASSLESHDGSVRAAIAELIGTSGPGGSDRSADRGPGVAGGSDDGGHAGAHGPGTVGA